MLLKKKRQQPKPLRVLRKVTENHKCPIEVPSDPSTSQNKATGRFQQQRSSEHPTEGFVLKTPRPQSKAFYLGSLPFTSDLKLESPTQMVLQTPLHPPSLERSLPFSSGWERLVGQSDKA